MTASPGSLTSGLHEGQRSSYGMSPRSSTTPDTSGPPSPDALSPNLDCPFPPFGATIAVPTKQMSGGVRTTSGENHASTYAPLSSRTAASGNLLQKADTISSGLFTPTRSQTFDFPTSHTGHQRIPTNGSLMLPSADVAGWPYNEHDRRPSTASGHSRTSTNSSSGALPRATRKNGYGGFGRAPVEDDVTQDTLRPEIRANTFPLQSNNQDATRRPSESGVRLQTQKSLQDLKVRSRKKSMSGPDLSKPLPPRSPSLRRVRGERTLADEVPPIPSNLAAEFGIGNPYHTPTESQSSSTSGASEASKVSSRSSPPRSSPQQLQMNIPDSHIDDLTAEIQSSIEALTPRELLPSLSIKPQYLAPIASVSSQGVATKGKGGTTTCSFDSIVFSAA